MRQTEEDKLKELLEKIRRVSGGPIFSFTIDADKKTIMPLRGLGLFFNRLLAITEDIFRDIL